jgi:hypothetical protein
MADYDSLVQRQAGQALDFMIGQIREVDNPTERPSQVGPPQLVQDVILEDDQGRQFVVQFWDINRALLTRSRDDREFQANFEGHHIGQWIRVENTADDEKRATLKRFDRNASVSKHYSEKRGIRVVLKATKMARFVPLLDQGQEFPIFRRTRSDKKPPRRRVPGQEPQQENRGMTQQQGNQGRPPQGGGRPPQGQQGGGNTSQQGAPPQNGPQGPRPDPDQALITRMNDVLIWCEAGLLTAYAQDSVRQHVQVPRAEWLEGPIKSLQICLKNKVNLVGGEEREIKAAVWRLAQMYVAIHLDLIPKYQNHPKLPVPEGFEMFKRVTTTFIAITGQRSWTLKI